MKQFQIALCLILLCGCSILKKSSKTMDESSVKISKDTQSETATSASKEKSGRQLIYKKDSSGADYTIHFWPKGKLEFSTTGQISGEFDSIMLKGKQDQVYSTVSILGTNELEKSNASNKTQQVNRSNTDNKKFQKVALPDIKLILSIIIIIVFGGYLLFKRLFRA